LINGSSVAEAMDLSDYKVNHEALHVLRRITSKGCSNGWIASHRSVSEAMVQVNKLAHTEIPYSIIPNIDGVEFDYEKLLIFCLKMFNLYDIAKEEGNVMLAITLDQADISSNICHIRAGVKFIDRRGIDPISGLPIGATDGITPQSRNVCIPFKMVMLRDSKEVYEDHFRDFFEFFAKLHNGSMYGMKKFNIKSPQDLSSHWKTLFKGGAAKNNIFFCHCCNCQSKQITIPREEPCEACIKKGKTICYHWPVGDKETLQKTEQELQKLEESQEYDHLQNVDIESMKTHYDANQENPQSDVSSVDYICITKQEKLQHLKSFLEPDIYNYVVYL
jgi:hypothetical protein